MCNEVVHIDSRSLEFIPDHFKTKEMSNEAVEADPYILKYVPVYLRTQEICIKAVENYLCPLKFVPDHFKIREMCERAVEVIEWYDGLKKRKAKKAQIKEELMPLAWHTSRWWNWCVPEDEKKETETFWG